jgi:hypothetical protein
MTSTVSRIWSHSVVVAVGSRERVCGVQVRPDRHQLLLPLGRVGGTGHGFVLEVPALPALHHPQPPGLVRARLADVLAARRARHRDDVDPAGGEVDAAHGQRPDAHAVVFGELAGDVPGQGEQGFLCAAELVLIHPDRAAGGRVESRRRLVHLGVHAASFTLRVWGLAPAAT